MTPHAWGCETAQAGLSLSARCLHRAYLALHPYARSCFFGDFPGFIRFFDQIEELGCLPGKLSQIF